MKSENSFLGLTFFLVLALSVPVASNLFLPVQSGLSNRLKKKITDNELPAGRLPANTEALASHRPVIGFAKSLSVDIGCKPEVALGEVSGHHLRLTGALCQAEETLTVKNLTNGYTANLIHFKKKGFTTDFMDLSEGENSIEITRTNAEGLSQTQNVKVTRQPAQTPEQHQ